MACDKDAVARKIVERVFRYDDIPVDMVIRKYFDTKKERVYMTQVLNGPVANWLSEGADCRWLSVRASDLEGIRTAGDFMAVCREHLS